MHIAGSHGSPQLTVRESNMQALRVAFEMISTDFADGCSFITKWGEEQKVTWTSLCMFFSWDFSSKLLCLTCVDIFGESAEIAFGAYSDHSTFCTIKHEGPASQSECPTSMWRRLPGSMSLPSTMTTSAAWPEILKQKMH